jgi:ribosomal-protein-alanine N-acetyltransferase
MLSQWRVRRLRPSDLPAILEIETRCFGPEAYDRNLFADLYRTCGPLFLLAERSGRVCAYAVASARGERAEVISIAVDPACRNQGLASLLMDSLSRRLKVRGVTRVILSVKVTNRPAAALYEKFGFRRTRRVRRYYEDGEDAWVMVKNL